jgi:hypothetical protein
LHHDPITFPAERDPQHGTCELDVLVAKGESIAECRAGGEREAINSEMMHALALARPQREQGILGQFMRGREHGQSLRLRERAAEGS